MADFFGGIDFSGAREPLANLWTAVGEERDGRLHIVALQPHAFRADLRAYVAGGWRAAAGAGDAADILWGADFPFGLPAAAADSIAAATDAGTGWAALLDWVADRPADEVRDACAGHHRTPRLTDVGGAKPPLDLRLYRQTLEGLRLLHEIREAHRVAVVPQAPDGGADTTLIEVYPSGAARELGLPRRRAPGRPGETRARAAALRTYADFGHPSLEAAAATLEDAWDASIACITAWLCRDALDDLPDAATADPRRLSLEGWIFVPPGALQAPGAASRA